MILFLLACFDLAPPAASVPRDDTGRPPVARETEEGVVDTGRPPHRTEDRCD